MSSAITILVSFYFHTRHDTECINEMDLTYDKRFQKEPIRNNIEGEKYKHVKGDDIYIYDCLHSFG